MSSMRSVWLIVILPLGLIGCQGEVEDVGGDALRIASLAPALTQMLVELDTAGHIVAVGEHDDALPAELADEVAVVGRFADIQTEALLAARPTHVLLQTDPTHLQRLGGSAGFEVLAWPYPRSIDDVLETLAPRDGERVGVGGFVGRADEARALRASIERRLDELASLASAVEERPRVLMLIGTRPVTASGPGTVLDEMLELAGARNAAPAGQAGAPTFDREMLLAAAPEVIVLLSPGGRELAALDEDPRLAELRGLEIPAVRDGRIAIVNHPLALLPTTTIPDVVAELLGKVHPELAEAAREIVAAGEASP